MEFDKPIFLALALCSLPAAAVASDVETSTASPETTLAADAETEELADLDVSDFVSRAAADLPRGAALYAARCPVCHGLEGRGDGPIARFLDPKPADLTRGVFKFRSTPTGHPPTDDDLFRTITAGVPGSAMLSWAGLTADDRWQLVFYVRSLFGSSELLESDPIEIPNPPTDLDGLSVRGAAIYAKMQCGRCHGPSGRGDGTAAFEIQDDHGRWVRPFDFSRSWKMKGGSAPRSIYRTLRTGLDGSGMPSYGDALSPRDTWALVAFLRVLFVDKHPED